MKSINQLLKELGVSTNEARRLIYNGNKYGQIQQGYMNRNARYGIHMQPISLTPEAVELVVQRTGGVEALTNQYKEANKEYRRGSTAEINETIANEVTRLNSLMGYDFVTYEEIAALSPAEFRQLVNEADKLERYVIRAMEESEMYGGSEVNTTLIIASCRQRIAEILHISNYEEAVTW